MKLAALHTMKIQVLVAKMTLKTLSLSRDVVLATEVSQGLPIWLKNKYLKWSKAKKTTKIAWSKMELRALHRD